MELLAAARSRAYPLSCALHASVYRESRNFLEPLTKCLAFVIAAIPVTASAYVSGEGHSYTASCNADGYVLTSDRPVIRQIGSAAGRSYSEAHERLYLGRSCDAASLLHGKGTWDRANGGLWVRFPDKTFEFGGQEPFCSEDGGTVEGEMNCRH